ncbi:MAG: MarR family winged helix-turn-helix transcriptional regulator [Propionibacteriaceae bacterium]|nr:MarR family winged helix-turn-helix transcriptional regulator [Propionibacteriaceae bacterium]
MRSEHSHPRPDSELSEVELLLRLARRWRHLGADAAGGHGLAPHQQRALLAVARIEGRTGCGVRVSALAEHLGIAARSATEVADALESAGLLVRTPDPTDRRAVLLVLTDPGHAAVAEVRDCRRSAAEAAVGALPPTDRAELRRLLTVLLAEPAD